MSQRQAAQLLSGSDSRQGHIYRLIQAVGKIDMTPFFAVKKGIIAYSLHNVRYGE